MNGVDLAQFQFDYDMSFAVFFMNADGTIYGRYGTRDARPDDADKDISLLGLRAGMQAALALHHGYPANAQILEPKLGSPPKYLTAEQYPEMQSYTPKINYQSDVAKSCIHCHQIHNAERQGLRDSNQLIPDKILYPYPMPHVVGLSLDSTKRATVKQVIPGSAAAAAKLKVGDEIRFANGQPLVSVADFQWVLHQTPDEGASIPLKVLRAGKEGALTLSLSNGWRKASDFTWRVSTWDLRRMALGGMSLELDESGQSTPLNLKVKGVGKYGGHAVARKAGVQAGDRLLSLAGVSETSSEAELIAHILNTSKKGDSIPITVRRGSRTLDLKFVAQ